MATASTEAIVYVSTDDNISLAGLLISPADSAPAPAATIVWIHGNAASFYDYPYVLVGRELAALGYTVILANTRGHDIATTLWKADDHSPMAGGGGSGWERMEDAPRDLAAWVHFAMASAAGPVLLAGHSMGAQKVLLYAADAQDTPSVRMEGVALVSPDLHGLRIPGELETARALVAEGHGMEVTPASPWAPWYRQSAQTVVSHAETADRLLHTESGVPVLAGVTVPLLATFGARERNAEVELAAIRATAVASPAVETTMLADADHFYSGQEAALARELARWAGERR